MGTTAQPACCTSHGSYPLGLGVPTLCQGCQGFPLRGGPLPNTRILSPHNHGSPTVRATSTMVPVCREFRTRVLLSSILSCAVALDSLAALCSLCSRRLLQRAPRLLLLLLLYSFCCTALFTSRLSCPFIFLSSLLPTTNDSILCIACTLAHSSLIIVHSSLLIATHRSLPPRHCFSTFSRCFICTDAVIC